MALYLQMDGVDDYIKLPSMTLTKIVADVLVVRRTDKTRFLWDFRTGIGFSYMQQLTNGTDTKGTGSYDVNGTANAAIPNGTRCTITHTFSSGTDDGNIFSDQNGANNLQGNIYSIKIYNGTTLQASYDMTTGTVQDQSGNGRHATLTGGTWLDDGTGGGTPTTQDGTTSLVGYGTVSTTGNILKQATANLLGNGLLTADGSIVGAVNVVTGTASLLGTGLLTASGTKIQNALANLIGTGTLTTYGIMIGNGQAALIGQGLLTANGVMIPGIHILDGSASLLGTGLLNANADVIHIAVYVDGTFTAVGLGVLNAFGTGVSQKKPPIISSIKVKGNRINIKLNNTSVHLKGTLNNTIHLKGGIQ